MRLGQIQRYLNASEKLGALTLIHTRLSSGVDVKTLSSMLSHYSAGFTLNNYMHIANDM